MDTHESAAYEVVTYDAPVQTDWYHFLHGNVPGHQIDFIFRPEVPQGSLTRQHFSHLARLVKYIEPRHGNGYAFAIGNLSRDDTQYEPGHGGVVFVFGLRIHGAFDHAGRQDPPFCHALACADRQLDVNALLETSLRFHHQLLERPHSPTDGNRWYQSYLVLAQRTPLAVRDAMHAYTRAFDALPKVGPSDLGLRWTIEGAQAPRRVVIVHPDQASFAVLAEHAARIAGVLVESDVRWTVISTGREQDLPGGTTVRFVPECDAVQEPDDAVLLHIDQVPTEPREIAQRLFGAHEVRISETNRLRLKWRHMGARPQAAPDPGLARPWAKPAEEADKPADVEPAAESSAGLSRPHVDTEATKKRRRSMVPVVAAGMLVAGWGLAGIGVMASRSVATSERVVKSATPVKAVEPVKSTEPVQSAGPVESVDVPAPSVSASASTAGKGRRAKPARTTGTGRVKANPVIGGKLK